MGSPNNTASRLLEATIAVISAQGEAAVKVDAIAAAADITKPSLYHFFGDRDGLIIAAQAERFRRAVLYGQNELLAGIEKCQSLEEYADLLTAGVRAFGTPEGAERRRVRIEVLGSAASRPALRVRVNAIMIDAVSDLARIVDIGRARGWVNETISSQTMAIWWYGTLLGRHLVDTNDAFDPADWDAAMIKTIRHLVLSAPISD